MVSSNDLYDTGLRVTFTNSDGEVYMGPGKITIDRVGNIWILDDEGDPLTLRELVDDGQAWLNAS